MNITKKPFEFWNYRDTRKEKFHKPKPVQLYSTQTGPGPKTVPGYISHHILLPISDLPKMLIDRLKADLTISNPEFQKAKKYGKGFVPYSIPEFIYLYAIDTKYLGLPRSVKMNYVHARFKECGLALNLVDVRPDFPIIDFKQKLDINPYFYQIDAINRITQGNVLIRLKCGKGKTILSLMAVAKIRLRTLIIVRTKILMKQWVDSINQVFDIKPEEIGIIQGKTRKIGLITVAMEETLVNLTREEKRNLGGMVGHIVIDEGHEAAATQYRDLLTYFKARYVTGLSGTPERDDGLTPVLKLYIGPIVEMDDLGDFKTRVMLRKTNFFYHFEGKKDKYHKLIEALIHNEDRNQMIIGDILKLTGEGRIVICYSNRIEHMEILEQMAKKAMPTLKTDILASRKYGVSLKIEDQNLIRENLKNLNLHGIFGDKIVEQGFDCPPLEVAIMATPSKSRRLIEQVLGRCQREYPGKKEAIILDYIDELTKVLLYQFFAKNRRIYKNYHKEYLL